MNENNKCKSVKNHINLMCERYPALCGVAEDVCRAVDMLCGIGNGKILLCGNGGSAADCEHIAGELLKGFLLKRTPDGAELGRLSAVLGEEKAARLQRGIAAVPLVSVSGALSAFANDVDPELVFAQLVYAMGRENDILLCLSTSGNSANVVRAASVARAMGMKTIALTGEGGGKLGEICDVTVAVPERETFKVQELHLPVYHAICAELERRLFSAAE